MNNAPFDGGTPSPSLGLNMAYQAAFNDYMAAGTPQAKNEALTRMEQAAIAGPLRPSAAPSSAPPAALTDSPAYRDLLAKALSSPTPQARAHFMAEMERLAQTATQAAPAAPEGPLEGFEPAQSIGDLPAPADLVPHIIDQAGFDGVREAALAVGIPKAVWGEALMQAHEHLPLLKASEQEWAAHMDGVFSALDKVHGSPEARSQVVRDAATFLNAVAAADPRLSEAADLMRLTPWGLSTAAQLHRAGIRPGKR